MMPANEKRRYVMTSDFWLYIAENIVANFWRYPIRRRVTYASALELLFSSPVKKTEVTNFAKGENLFAAHCKISYFSV